VQGDQPATGLRPRYPAHPPASTRRARPGHTRDPARRPVCEATADRRQLLCRFATIILAGPQRGRGCDSPAAGLRETGRTVFCSTLSSSAIEGDRLVGMRESRALCEISKSCGRRAALVARQAALKHPASSGLCLFDAQSADSCRRPAAQRRGHYSGSRETPPSRVRAIAA